MINILILFAKHKHDVKTEKNNMAEQKGNEAALSLNFSHIN